MRITSRTSRLIASAGALAFGASLVLGQVALADTEVGSTGDHLFTDSSTKSGATCKYTRDRASVGRWYLTSITAVAPQVWWPDLNSGNTNEHGHVGWRFAVQTSDDTTTWTTVAHSSYQKKTAYEDQIKQYDPNKEAPFTNMTVSFNSDSYSSTYWRIVVRPIWYKPGGGVMGYIKHPVQYYTMKWSTNAGQIKDYCFHAIQKL